MRLVSLEHVAVGSKLGKPIYTDSGRTLLSDGVILTEAFLNKLNDLAIESIYIDDEISKDIEVEEVISNKTKTETKKIIKHILDNKTLESTKTHKQLTVIVNDIVDEILANSSNLINLVDIKTKDSYTFSHCINVAVISTIIGVSMGYPVDKLRKVCLGGLLHDIGKVHVPNDIVNKPGKLTEAEFAEMKKHTTYGYNMVKDNNDYCPITKAIILMHHEKSDGSGYPLGVTHDKIHECVRIVSIADIYDAMTSDRVYRKKLNPNEAVEYIVGMSYQWFDKETVDNFRKCIAPYPVGSCIRLSTGDIGIVLEVFSSMPTRPIVRLVKSKDGTMYGNDKVLNLMTDLTTSIIESCEL